MRGTVGALLLLLMSLAANPAMAQQVEREAAIKQAVPYHKLQREVPGLTLQDYNEVVREMAKKELREQKEATPYRRRTAPIYTAPQRDITSPLYTPPPTPRVRRSYRSDYSPPSLTTPQSGSTYDWRSGNSYSWRKDMNGKTPT